MASFNTGCCKKNMANSSHDMICQKRKTIAWTHVLYIPSGLFHVLQKLNVATTDSKDNIKLIREFNPNVPQYVTVHCVDCSCYVIFYIIDICWKWWSINFVFNVSPQKEVTQSEAWKFGRPSAESKVSITSPTNPSLWHVFIQISSNPEMPMGWCFTLLKNEVI